MFITGIVDWNSISEGVFFVCFFLLGISAILHYFKRSILPPVLWILLAGVVYGIVQNTWLSGLPMLHLGPEVVLYIFLPVLIFDSARKLRPSELRGVGVEVGFFATVGVLVSMVLVGVPFA